MCDTAQQRWRFLCKIVFVQNEVASVLRIILADDHPIVAVALSMLLQQIDGVTVVGVAENGRAGVTLVRNLRPDVVLMDVSMQDLNGIEATAQIRAISPATRVIMLSSHVDGAIVERALNAGASGYVIKGASPDELRAALKAAAAGDVYLSPAVAKQLVPRLTGRTSGSPLDQLSTRQREVLQLIAEGKRTKDIAKALEVSVKTVETHRIAVMERLEIYDVPGLVMFALRHGLVNADRY